MIAEVLLILAGHDSSLFPSNDKLHPDFVPLLHPGERECLESLASIAQRYRNIRQASSRLSISPSRYICAFCSRLNEILKNEYESLVVDTEARILSKDDNYVGRGSFVPLSSIRATFTKWDAPLTALELLLKHLESSDWPAGTLIDLLLARSETGIYRVSSIMSSLAEAVQLIWRAQLQAFLVHGSLSASEPLANNDYELHDKAIPSCISSTTRDSIVYIGRAIATVKSLNWHRQVPSSLSLSHSRLLDTILPQDQHGFDSVISQIRADISEWLWANVLTAYDVEDAVDSLANYFLLQNGEFSLSLIREIERLKQTRLTARSGPKTLIREQDLHHAMLRASLGTTAQHDRSLQRIRFQLPSGPVAPLLHAYSQVDIPSLGSTQQEPQDVRFDNILLGTPLRMTYKIEWPLDLFLHSTDLSAYGDLFSFLTSLRHVHTRIHVCWTSLSNAQRARRRWTGLDEGGTADVDARKGLLRCGWGVVRLMGWFLDVLLSYMMIDVVETEFRKLKTHIKCRDKQVQSLSSSNSAAFHSSASKDSLGSSASTDNLDFTTLRRYHTIYLERLLAASLLTHTALTGILRHILDICEYFTGLIERWGGDVLPPLLFEGSISDGYVDSIGQMVKERYPIVKEIDQGLNQLLESFYDQLSHIISQSTTIGDASKTTMYNMTSVGIVNTLNGSIRGKGRRSEHDGETRRHIERLLLRLDFNRKFSKPSFGEHPESATSNSILREGGLA